MNKYNIGDLVFVRRPDNKPDGGNPTSSDGLYWYSEMDLYENSIYIVDRITPYGHYLLLPHDGLSSRFRDVKAYVFSEEWLELYNGEDFFIGGEYIVKPPKTSHGMDLSPSWVSGMNEFSGSTVTIKRLDGYEANIEESGYRFNIGWLIPICVDEMNVLSPEEVDIDILF